MNLWEVKISSMHDWILLFKSNSIYTLFMTWGDKRNDIIIRIDSCLSPLLWFVYIHDLWTFNNKGMRYYYEINTLIKSSYMNKTYINTQTAQRKCISKYDHVGYWFLNVCKNKWYMYI